MEQVDQLERQAEAEFLRGKTAAAADDLQQAEAEMAGLEQRYGADLPPGHVPLLGPRRRSTRQDQWPREARTDADCPRDALKSVAWSGAPAAGNGMPCSVAQIAPVQSGAGSGRNQPIRAAFDGG